MRLALGRGACTVLLDGLDEVGDNRTAGQSLRKTVVKRVQRFADRWCTDDRPNRLVISSRIEGYWNEALTAATTSSSARSARRMRWSSSCCAGTVPTNRTDHRTLPERGQGARRGAVAGLLPQLMDTPGVQRLATNPLLLTILVLISENVGKLPQNAAPSCMPSAPRP